MSDRIIYLLGFAWLGYTLFLTWHFFHPSYNWTPREVAREHIYDFNTDSNPRP